MQVGRDEAVPEHQCGLDESGDTGTGLEVADVRLHRTDQQRVGAITVGGKGTGEGPHLDRIADRRARSVRLDVPDLVGCDPCSLQGRGDRRPLGVLAGYGDAVGVSVLGHGGAEDLGVDAVTVADGLGEGFDDDDGAAFTSGVPVGRVVEGLAAAVGAEEAALRLRDGRVGSDDDVHATGQREVALTVPDTLGRKVNRNEGAGARGVDGHAGPAEVERERDAVRQHRHHHSGGGMRLEAKTAGAALVL